MIIYWLTGLLLLIDITLLLVNDFFPGTLDALGIPMWTLFALMAVLAVISIATHDPEREKRFRIFSLGIMTAYPLVMLALLPALGGESQSGITLTSPFLWMLLTLVLWSSWREHVKDSREANENP
ncbi:MAG: hypothetical protein ACQEV0_01055 [Bacillota bacterium]